MTRAKFDIKKFDGTGDFGSWRIKMRALLIRHGCEAALEVLPANMEAQTKAELNKKAHNEFNKIVLDLANIKVKFEDEDFALLLLTSLPASYEHFMDTLLYRREALLWRTGSVQLGDNRECKIRGTLEKEGFTVKLHSGKVKVINGSRVVLSGIRRDNYVYSLDGHAMVGELNASVEEKDSLTQVWHKRLGHINEVGLQVLEKQGFFAKKSLGLYVRGRTVRKDLHQSRGKSRSKSQGGRLKCYICQSEDHLKRNCPKNNRKKSTGYVKKDEQPSSTGSEVMTILRGSVQLGDNRECKIRGIGK
nr:retrovirus-related Pol polyprotein from transposon TNT 1-94 [Tanacetum cinerariifolium]